ncbi:50S ribosomal protein L6 [Halogeometricum borinquense]|uniref:Large ribosomal subunit protein uL6 n=2 Tax=Halogeometricum borinquense TaxID=60847 RepID=E4NQ69_HALBP|nr:50S ribosomal protein L6 [Halogeometricum borinquense]ADQ66631.1 LSU ribosomal protein L6P [Halogeometricum borinquense DSM 11551]ELY30738.1 50S ribosomal protein L6P [Halogeometricum borinquense DSM 11551]QIB75052.1 50S ribosomal protein L6 [Halogeometricum borinquense]QIQ75967.1 50S ribosomal protein L6 [Halogeometricum borinquense]RYJ14478.1 50S ribosomal protein L6 [Halogeometricum borinquense]
MNRVEIDIPDDVSAEVKNLDLTVDGPNGSVTKTLWYPDISVTVEDGQVVIESEETNAKTNATIGTFESHVENMLYGVTEGWEYKMEVYYAHFPMQVNVQGDEVVIENFLGEKSPRHAKVRGDTDVQVDGEELVLTGPDKEDVGQTAADIEQLTRVKDKDTRVFQDGVYITQKPQTGGA